MRTPSKGRGETGDFGGVVEAISATCLRYAEEMCLPGWLFTVLLDHRFIDSRLTAHPVRRSAPSSNTRTCVEASDLAEAASDHLQRIANIADPVVQVEALHDLTLFCTPSLTRDSFADDPDPNRALVDALSRAHELNVVIIGAGPIGLALASALKVALRTRVNVLVVENRLSADHHKMPYTRRWITNVPRALLDGLVEPLVIEVFRKIGNGVHIGSTIDVFETLLFLSCRRLGVKFLFARDFDLAKVGDLPVHLVFDASGNRLTPARAPDSSDRITVIEEIDGDLVRTFTEQGVDVTRCGIDLRRMDGNRKLAIASYGETRFPLFENERVRLAIMKLIGIPVRLEQPLLDYVATHNPDNKYYVWTGTLRRQINQVLVMINLTKAEHDYLCKNQVFPMAIADAARDSTLRASLDERTGAIFDLVATAVGDRDDLRVEAPFLYEPHWVRQGATEHLFGKPLIRVGDSIYNGNVKLGNGLAAHLQALRPIRNILHAYGAVRPPDG
jgi:hypothetical protein